MNGQGEIVKYLIAAGMDLDLRTSWHGFGGMGLAECEGQGEIVKVLNEFMRDPIGERTKYRPLFNLPGSCILSSLLFLSGSIVCLSDFFFLLLLVLTVTPALEVFLELKGDDTGEVVKFSPPFTLYELSLSIKSHFKLSDNVELSFVVE